MADLTIALLSLISIATGVLACAGWIVMALR